ncbi:MAG: hypothetical protein JO166_03830, partial [Deltaproteobacteria bacterium]|nr:hypothetical protein [Deltaproteobacteria bacterium]
ELAKHYDAQVLSLLAEAEANSRDWPGAMADFKRALKLTPDDSDLLSGHATLALYLDQMNEFDSDESSAVSNALKTKATLDTESAGWINTAAWLCALYPKTPADSLERLIALQHNAVSQFPDSYFFKNTLAGIDCQMGGKACLNELAASMSMKKSDSSLNEPNGTPWDWIFMALAEARAGHLEDARRLLRQAMEHASRVVADPLYSDPKYAWGWQDELQIQILRREVEQQIKASTGRNPTRNPISSIRYWRAVTPGA